jgi:hypothetical protein
VDVHGPRILRLERYTGELRRGGIPIGAAATSQDEKRGYDRSG